jgi:excisionase family DNA binding protein
LCADANGFCVSWDICNHATGAGGQNDCKSTLPTSKITAREAATRLGVTPQTIRNYVRAGKLEGDKDAAGLWRVSAETVERMSSRPALPVDVVARVSRLAEEVGKLRGRADTADQLVAALERERDRFRGDAAAAREAALILVGNARELDAATRTLLTALEAQANALVQLLAPATAEDLGNR